MAGHGLFDDLLSGFDPTKWGQPGGGFGQFGHDISNSANDIGSALGLGGGTLHPQAKFGFDPTQWQVNQGQSNEDRQQQQLLDQMLLAQAQGKGPSVVQQQLQNATDANNRNALSLGQTLGAGTNAGAAMRNIEDVTAGNQQTAAGQSAILKAQEQLAGQQQLAQALGQQRGQDIGLAESQAQLGLGGQQAQAANDLATNQLNTQIAAKSTGNIWNAISGAGQAAGALAGLAGGGPVPNMPKSGYADGGEFDINALDSAQGANSFGKSFGDLGKALHAKMSAGKAMGSMDFSGSNASAKGAIQGIGPDDMSTPTSIFDTLGPEAGATDLAAEAAPLALAAKGGGKVPGKPKVEGNDTKNDTVPAMLSPGEYVVDNESQEHPLVHHLVNAIKAFKGEPTDEEKALDFTTAVHHHYFGKAA